MSGIGMAEYRLFAQPPPKDRDMRSHFIKFSPTPRHTTASAPSESREATRIDSPTDGCSESTHLNRSPRVRFPQFILLREYTTLQESVAHESVDGFTKPFFAGGIRDPGVPGGVERATGYCRDIALFESRLTPRLVVVVDR